MTQSVYQFRLYCNYEATYVSTWGTTPPTLCPNDHPDRSDIASVVIIDTISTELVTAKDSAPDAGYYQSSTVQINVPMGSIGDVTSVNISYPFDIYIWSASISQPSNGEGDIFNYVVAPDTTIGLLTQNALIGDTTVYASSTVFTYLTRGIEISFTDGINTQYVGMVTGLDLTAGTVTFQNALIYNFNTGTQLKFTVYPIRNHYIDYVGDRMFFAQKGLRSRYIPAGTPIRIDYTNNNGQAKKIYFQLEYYMV